MDLTPREDPGALPEGAPEDADAFWAGPNQAAIWLIWDGFPASLRCLINGPIGPGQAWLRTDPTTLALQLGDCEGRIGKRQVAVRRNPPKLRRRNRIVRIVGDSIHWELTWSHGYTFRIRDQDGQIVWRTDADGKRWAADHLDADQLAALVLYDRINIETRLSPNPFRYI